MFASVSFEKSIQQKRYFNEFSLHFFFDFLSTSINGQTHQKK